MPACYAGVEAELAAARTALALADVSAFAKISLQGPGVPDLTQALLSDSPTANVRGVARLTAPGVAWACRLTLDHLLLMAADVTPAGLQGWLARATLPRNVVQTDVTSAFAAFGLIGPHREKLLPQLTSLDVRSTALPAGACAETSLAGVQALLVPWEEASSAGMWILVGWDVGEFVWEVLLESGRRLGITALGFEGLHQLLATVATGNPSFRSP
jgi:4-methylaminobutanoate oxidase (formaldehyde-forming)